MTRLGRSRIPVALWGVIGVVAAGVVALLIFVGPSRVTESPFVLKAVFRSETQLVPRTPVRIAGVRVGAVTSVRAVGAGSDAAVVTMQIDRAGLPIGRDATVKIRSRLILEGNVYLELSPGRPSAGALRSGGTVGADRTSGPVQLDRVLTDLTSGTRMDLRSTVQGLGEAIGGSAHGEPAARALNRSLGDWPFALRDAATTLSALRGERSDDLSGLVDGAGRTFGALAANEAQLGDLVDTLDTTMQATAEEAAPLAASIAALPPLLDRAQDGLGALDAGLPPTRTLALAARPGLRELPATISAALPWIAQGTPLLSRDELGGVVADLAPAVADTAGVIRGLTPTVRAADTLGRCLVNTLLPTGDAVIHEPGFTSTSTVSQEFLQTFVGLASAAQNFDGNGRYVRAQTGGGDFPVATSKLPEQGEARGNAARQPLGTRPASPAKAPPLRTDVRCGASKVPDLDGAATGAGP